MDERNLKTIRSQAAHGDFAHYGGLVVQDLLNHIDAQQDEIVRLRHALERIAGECGWLSEAEVIAAGALNTDDTP